MQGFTPGGEVNASATVQIERAIRTGVARDKVEQVAFRAFSIAGHTYRLNRHNPAEIQDIREEASLIFRMEDGEGIGLLDQAT